MEEWIKKFAVRTSIVAAITLIAGMAGCPKYHVWQSRLAGEAQLAEATANRRIKIQEAEAVEEAATHLANAEIARANGVAQANAIIGTSLKGNEVYLKYLWIQALSDKDGSREKEVIYIPTEANLPITESIRLLPQPPSLPKR